MPTVVEREKYLNLPSIPPVNISLLPPSMVDMFFRLRVSEPTTAFSSSMVGGGWYDLQWWLQRTGTTTIYHNPNDSTLQLGVGTANGDRVVLQSKRYPYYQPGKSQFILITDSIDENKTNCYKYYGYGDDYNGAFFRVTQDEIALVRRSYSGKAVQINANPQFNEAPDEIVKVQGEWSYDNADGTTFSGLNLSKVNSLIFWFGVEWLGVGTVACGVVVDQTAYLLHQFHHSNRAQSTYMTRGSLPVRYEIVNTGVTASATYTRAICSTVISEGGQDRTQGFSISRGNGATQITVNTTGRPILTLRPKRTLSNLNTSVITNIKNLSEFDITKVEVKNEGNDAIVEVRYYPEVTYNSTATTEFTGSNFSTAGQAGYDRSAMEYDVSSTAVTTSNYIVIDSFVVPSSAANNPQASGVFDVSKHPIVQNIDGTKHTAIQLFVASDTSTTKVAGTFTWKEVY